MANWKTLALASLLALHATRLLAAGPPNVVLIISDDQAWTDYGFMGHALIQTPHLDRLAAQSIVYTRGYVPSSLCRPSLMTLATGLFPHQHRVTGNDPPRMDDGKLSDRREMLKHVQSHATLPRMLGKLGYQSFQSGKWWEGSYQLGGFTHGMTHGDPRRGGRHGDLGLKIGREGLKPIFDFIEQCGDRPFFVWYAPFLPHAPHNPPQRLLEKYADKVDSPFVARYYAMCEWFDETCGELLSYLEAQGLSENTLLIYVTDNGWIQDPRSRNFAAKSKRSPYDGGLRTPIMLRWPGTLRPRRDDQTLVSSVDLVPTILAACGLSPAAEMQGVNLLDPRAPGQRDTIFGEVFTHDEIDIDEPAANVLFRWCIRNQWKLIVSQPDARAELYDLGADPFEKHNLAGEKPGLVADLQGKLDHWWKPVR